MNDLPSFQDVDGFPEYLEVPTDHIIAENHAALKSADRVDLGGQAVELIFETLQAILPWASLHTSILLGAHKWNDRSRDPKLLLQGEELTSAIGWVLSPHPENCEPTTLQIAYITASERRSGGSLFQRITRALGLSRRGKIFLSYRRVDRPEAAREIYNGLSKTFGRHRLFLDIDTIPSSADFAEFISASLNSCSVMLVIIGPNWLNSRDGEGRRRIDRKDDWVRIEIETALRKSFIQILPVIIGPAKVPKPEELPDSLRELAFRNSLILDNECIGSNELAKLARAVSEAQRLTKKAVHTAH